MKGFVVVVALLLFSLSFVEAQDPFRRIVDRIFGREFEADDRDATPEKVSAVVEANNRFALDLYQNLSSDDGNLLFSPYSIFSALAMTYEGARGETAEEIRAVFNFPEADVMRPGVARLYNEMNSEESYALNVANALWIQEDYKLLEDYLEVVKNYYGGSAENKDFIGDHEGSRIAINRWVEDRTNEKIEDLIPPGIINNITRIILTNAIYFKGSWAQQFNESETQMDDFIVDEDKKVRVPMMFLGGESFRYCEGDEAQVIELPYEGENTSMIIVLPKGDMEDFERSMSYEKLMEFEDSLSKRDVDVYLPRFTLRESLDLNECLKEMGMELAFSDEAADFSGMTGNPDLFISNVIHQTFVEVNEKGTEVIAVTTTGPIIPVCVFYPTVFRADHPFIFLIQNEGNILFVGRVVNPSN